MIRRGWVTDIPWFLASHIYSTLHRVVIMIQPYHPPYGLKSMQRRTEPSGFLTGTIGRDQRLKDGLTMPCSKRDKTSTRSCSFHAGANRYGVDLMCVCSPVSIPWSVSCALPVVSHITSPNCLSTACNSCACFCANSFPPCLADHPHTHLPLPLLLERLVPLDSFWPSTY